MQTAVGEVTYPLMGMMKWQRIHQSMLATPLTPTHLVLAHLTFVALRLATSCGVFVLALAPFGVFATWWGAVLALLAQILVGMTFATLVYAFTTRLHMTNRDFFDRIGVTAEQTFAPGDIDLDPRFDLVAEWQDYRLTSTLRLQDMLMTKLLEWMERREIGRAHV